MKKLFATLAVLAALWASPALASCNGLFNTGQICGVASGGPTSPGPITITGGLITLPQNDILVGNASNVAAAVAMSQDCTITSIGAITCLKTNNVAFGSLATQSSVTSAQLPSPFTNGTRQGNTSAFTTYAGSAPVNGDVAAFDVNGNIIDGGGAVGNVTASGSPTVHQTGVWVTGTSIKGVGAGTTGQAFISQGGSADPSYIGGARVLLNTLTASTSATLSDTTSLTSTYNEYDIVFENILPSSNGVQLEFQVHSAGAFKNTGYLATSSAWATTSVVANTTTFFPVSSASACSSTVPGFSGTLTITTPSGTTSPKIINSMGSCWNGTNSFLSLGGGFWNANGAVDGFQVLFNTGNITSGNIKIYGRL